MSFRFFLLTISPPVIGVAVGYLSGGRLSGFRGLRIRALWLVWLAAALQFAQYSVEPVRAFAEDTVGVPMLVPVFAVVLVWLGVNLPGWPRAIRLAGLAIALGAALNGAAIAANGRMPYDQGAVAGLGLRAGIETPKNEPAEAGTRLAFLGDTIGIPVLRKVASPGDVLIAFGAAALVVLAMRRARRPEETTDDPNPEPTPAPDAGHPADAGGAALHDRRPTDRGQLTR
jgi:hypothetical protein